MGTKKKSKTIIRGKTEFPKKLSIIICTIFIFVFIVIAIFIGVYYKKDENIALTICSIIADLLGMLYFVVQDLYLIIKKDSVLVDDDAMLQLETCEFDTNIYTLNNAYIKLKTEIFNSLNIRGKTINYINLELNDDNCSYELISKVYDDIISMHKELGVGTLTIKKGKFVSSKIKTIIKKSAYRQFQKNIIFIVNQGDIINVDFLTNFYVFIFQYNHKELPFVNLSLTDDEIKFIVDNSGIKSQLSQENLYYVYKEHNYRILINYLKSESDLIPLTSFEDKLNIFLRQRDYSGALKFYDKKIDTFHELGTPYYANKIKYIHANIIHFLQNYDDSLELLQQIIADYQTRNNLDERDKILYFDCLFLKAHVKKHIGEFEDCYNLLNSISKVDLTEAQTTRLKRSLFSPLIFMANIHTISSKTQCAISINELAHRLGYNFRSFDRTNIYKNTDYYYYDTYYPCYMVIENSINGNNEESYDEALKNLSNAINFYNENEPRLSTNCYMIRASLYRFLYLRDLNECHLKKMMNDWDVINDIYNSNDDVDILFTLAIESKMVEIFISHKENVTSNVIKAVVKRANEYYAQAIRLIQIGKVDINAFKYHKNFFELIDRSESGRNKNKIEDFLKTRLSLIP